MSQLTEQAIQPALDFLNRREVLVDHGLHGTREPSPHAGLDVPEQQFVALVFAQSCAAPVEVTDHHGNGEAPEQYAFVVEPQPPADHVEGGVDGPGGAVEPAFYLLRSPAVQMVESRFSRDHRIDCTQQPVEGEFVAGFPPRLEASLHLVSRLGPVGADFCQGQIGVGQFRAAAIDSIEDIDDDIQGFVRSGHFVDMQIDLSDPKQTEKAAHIFVDPGTMFG